LVECGNEGSNDDCDSCGKPMPIGIAKMIVDDLVFVVCFPCGDLLPDVIDEVSSFTKGNDGK